MFGLSKARFSILVVSMTYCFSVFAGDGALEINQTCALYKGCFAGDEAGFPVTITEPGSYILTSSLDVTRNADGIIIEGNTATLDLNGFGMKPVAPSFEGVSTGIYISAWNAEVRNGYVSGFELGIDMPGGPEGTRLSNLRIVNNRDHGVRLIGTGNRIDNCTIMSNPGQGLTLGASIFQGFAALSGNVILDNGTNIAIFGGIIELSPNQCGDDTACP